MLGSNKTRIVKLEQSRGARARRFAFYFDEVAEAEAQGLPYVLVPRTLSKQEWILYSITKHAMRRSADEIGRNFDFILAKVFSDPASVVD
jgi:hypothetical protein